MNQSSTVGKFDFPTVFFYKHISLMKYATHVIGQGAPRVAVVGAVHGDEISSAKIIKQLKELSLKQGTLGLILAHPTALQQGRRFITYDLNRSFPGSKNGRDEQALAHALHRYLKDYDYVIDIHSTNAAVTSLAIITRFDLKTKELLKLTPAANVALARKRVFGGHELISHHPCALSLDYGPKKNSVAITRAVSDVTQILRNLGLVPGATILYRHKAIYIITEQYKVSRLFEYTRRIHELEHIRQGDIIGYNGGAPISARYSFYPLFLHDGRYEGTFALAARTKKNITL